MARAGQTCGAVTGALMVIGLLHGKIDAEDDDARDLTYGLSRQLMEEFRKRNGSLLCKDLLGHDISTPAGLAAVREQRLVVTRCPTFVRDAAELLEALLEGE
jgi:C_GCAxxG_C_C family probable redox protein